jgi:hypothetical protein
MVDTNIKCDAEVGVALNAMNKNSTDIAYIICEIVETGEGKKKKDLIKVKEVVKRDDPRCEDEYAATTKRADYDEKNETPPSYKAMMDELIKMKGGYACFGFAWNKKEVRMDHACLIKFLDEYAGPNMKMKYTGSFKSFQKACPAISIYNECNDVDELKFRACLDEVKGKK